MTTDPLAALTSPVYQEVWFIAILCCSEHSDNWSPGGADIPRVPGGLVHCHLMLQRTQWQPIPPWRRWHPPCTRRSGSLPSYVAASTVTTDPPAALTSPVYQEVWFIAILCCSEHSDNRSPSGADIPRVPGGLVQCHLMLQRTQWQPIPRQRWHPPCTRRSGSLPSYVAASTVTTDPPAALTSPVYQEVWFNAILCCSEHSDNRSPGGADIPRVPGGLVHYHLMLQLVQWQPIPRQRWHPPCTRRSGSLPSYVAANTVTTDPPAALTSPVYQEVWFNAILCCS